MVKGSEWEVNIKKQKNKKTPILQAESLDVVYLHVSTQIPHGGGGGNGKSVEYVGTYRRGKQKAKVKCIHCPETRFDRPEKHRTIFLFTIIKIALPQN